MIFNLVFYFVYQYPLFHPLIIKSEESDFLKGNEIDIVCTRRPPYICKI